VWACIVAMWLKLHLESPQWDDETVEVSMLVMGGPGRIAKMMAGRARHPDRAGLRLKQHGGQLLWAGLGLMGRRSHAHIGSVSNLCGKVACSG
jgi:hypothetical protein